MVMSVSESRFARAENLGRVCQKHTWVNGLLLSLRIVGVNEGGFRVAGGLAAAKALSVLHGHIAGGSTRGARADSTSGRTHKGTGEGGGGESEHGALSGDEEDTSAGLGLAG